jgi:hypothetical protein
LEWLINNLTSLFWASKESSPDVTDVLEVGDGLSRLIIRTKRTKSRNTLTLVIVWFSYYAIFIAIVVSPPYQNAAPWKYPGLTQAIVAAFALGGIVHMIWTAWWVPRFSIANPAGIIDIKIEGSRLGRFAIHKLDVKSGDEVFRLVVKCPRRRLAKALHDLGVIAE